MLAGPAENAAVSGMQGRSASKGLRRKVSRIDDKSRSAALIIQQPQQEEEKVETIINDLNSNVSSMLAGKKDSEAALTPKMRAKDSKDLSPGRKSVSPGRKSPESSQPAADLHKPSKTELNASPSAGDAAMLDESSSSGLPADAKMIQIKPKTHNSAHNLEISS